jgi:hypothetical protein
MQRGYGERKVDETEREAGSVPADGGTRPGRRVALAVSAVVLVLAALVAVVVVRHRDTTPQRPPAPQGARGEPEEYRSSSPTASPSGPVPAFVGMTPSKVTAAWVERWPGPVTVNGAVRNVRVTLPGTRDQLSATVGQPTKDRRNEVAHVACLVKHRGTVSRPLLQTLVDGCLGPVLRPEERKAVLDWLIGADLSVPHYQFRRSPRFELLANHSADTSFALILNAR